jgi:hypothetical protein
MIICLNAFAGFFVMSRKNMGISTIPGFIRGPGPETQKNSGIYRVFLY